MATKKALIEQERMYESEIDEEYLLEQQNQQRQQQQQNNQRGNVAIQNPNFVDHGETDNEYNKTHEMTKAEVFEN